MAAWVTRQRAASGFLHGQVWILANKTHGDTPEWVGNLERVPAHLVYLYDRRSPGENCNCIYDGRPLRSWWPWPRSREL
ncbi:aa5d832a-8200-4114-91b4-6f27bc09eba2 [Thermothielavioides terrestris]|uniref:Aa5d832a-8200-4114-91b4-6f27bc09eba2 n=1 Tax=Thermothielavioides terrestris TaxID=2587410 RepID=A0A446BKE9_9PEZI|nr:aa5d832a-8200-4114-91b4-6f27bc09eba2 [Thermothielavioides terrestris]